MMPRTFGFFIGLSISLGLMVYVSSANAQSDYKWQNNGRCDDARYEFSSRGKGVPGTDETDCRQTGGRLTNSTVTVTRTYRNAAPTYLGSGPGVVVTDRFGNPRALVPANPKTAVIAGGTAAIAGLLIGKNIPIEAVPDYRGVYAYPPAAAEPPQLPGRPDLVWDPNRGWVNPPPSPTERAACFRSVQQEAARTTGRGTVDLSPTGDGLIGTFLVGATRWTYRCENGQAILGHAN